MKKCKEIVAQEYEFKMKHLDETYLQKEAELVQQYQNDCIQMESKKESVIKQAILNEKIKL